ncbi:MAG: wax ester/triacylglycerol synthase domain-containing protein [Solirubrobacterales bacterium]
MSEPDDQTVERLGPADASNLGGGINHLVIGLCRLDRRADGSVPSFAEVGELIEERLGRSPRFRQFPYLPEGESGLPVWADSQNFDLADHLVEAPTDGPVDRHELDVLLAEWMTTPIDETGPLWMVQYIPTTEGAALMVKSSHALADGLGSIALFAMLLFDISEEAERSEVVPWEARPLPDASEVRSAASPDETESGNPAETPLQKAISLISSPSALRETASSTAGISSYLMRKARTEIPASPLAAGTGTPLELHTLEYPLDRLKLLGRGLGTGATMNDVILGLTAGGFRNWCVENGHPPEDHSVRVPVALKKDRKKGESGNPGVAPMIVPLPLAETDSVRRVRLIRERTEAIKAAGEPGLNLAVRKLSRETPGALGDRMLRLVTGKGQANIAIHNLPGPPLKLYVLGAPTASFHSFTLPRAGLAIHLNVVSVGGVVSIGLAADQGVVGGLDAFVRGVEETEKALAEGVSHLDLVRRVPMLAPLEDEIQEDLASRMTERKVDAGETLVAEGESAEDFFLIVEGTFDVVVQGEPVRTMMPGDSFGEIALLRDTERTATVVAMEGGVVMVLGREDFLGAVAADPSSMVVADAIINTRLGDLGRYQVFGDPAN